jgi:ribose transport system permease protein
VRDQVKQLLWLTGALLLTAGLMALITWWRADFDRCPFLQPMNLLGLLRQASTLIVLACGMTLVIVSAGIDLSVGSVLAFACVLLALALDRGASLPVAILAALAGGAACGLLNGIAVVKGQIPSFIATLGMFLIARSLAFVTSGGQTIYVGSQSTVAKALPVALPVLAVLATWLLLSKTRFGRSLYAVGGNLEAARLSGIRTGTVRIGAFVLSGLAAGLAGVIYWARSGAGSNLAGSYAELDAIAAVIIGGTSISGGEGHVLGSLIGALLMVVLRNGLVLLGLSDELQKLVIGIVIVAAVLVDRLRGGGSGAK